MHTYTGGGLLLLLFWAQQKKSAFGLEHFAAACEQINLVE